MGLGLGAANSIDNARLYKTLKKRNTARATVKTTLSNDSNHRRTRQMKETSSIQDFFGNLAMPGLVPYERLVVRGLRSSHIQESCRRGSTISPICSRWLRAVDRSLSESRLSGELGFLRHSCTYSERHQNVACMPPFEHIYNIIEPRSC